MASQRITLPRGNTLVINFTNQDNSTPPNPISLLGATIAFTVKSPPGWDIIANDSTALWLINSTGNTGNTCTFTSAPADTWQLPGTYDFDITVNYNNGNVVTPITGQIVITPIATNRES
jgi:hypothetical protein